MEKKTLHFETEKSNIAKVNSNKRLLNANDKHSKRKRRGQFEMIIICHVRLLLLFKSFYVILFFQFISIVYFKALFC